MNFLKTLFWVILAVVLAIFATANWTDVTISLWADLQADVKLPLLILIAVLAGWLPTFLILRGRIWNLKRKLALAERPAVPPISPASHQVPDEGGAA